ncbi:hydrolase [Pseudonocardia sp. DSM 110487]|nr:hydrolase [Pseudonocardia sp. DSM 110487]
MSAKPLPSVATADLAAIAARCAAAADERRRLDPDVAAAVVDAGFARHFVPISAGGHAGTFADLAAAVVTVGEACAATAWCASLTASMSRMAAAFLPVEGQREIWSAGPDAVVVGSVTPLGRAEEVDGGWIVAGSWPYISFVEFSDWALVCAIVGSGSDQVAKLFAVPRSAYRVEETWFNVGMQATGSNTLVVDDAFVARPLAFDRADLFAGKTVESPDTDAPCYSAPLQAVNGLSFVLPALGAARGALGSFSGYIANKIRTAPSLPGVPGVQGNRATYEMAFARSAGEIDAAQLLLERAVGIADQGAATTPAETAQNLRDCSLAVDMLVTAVDRIFRTAGTTGQSTKGSLQRFWRDVNSISTHMAIQFEPAARLYATETLKV